MQEQEGNIQFDTMPDFRGMFSTKVNPESTFDEKEYDTLYEELVEKCHPNKFIDGNNFDKKLFEKANKLYAEILKCKDLPEKELIHLRNQAIEILGAHFSTKRKYEYLDSFLNPKVYTAVEPEDYDSERVSEAANWYTILQKNRNDIRELEKLETDASAFIDRRKSDLLIIEQREAAEREAAEREEAMKKENERQIQEKKDIVFRIVVVAILLLIIVIIIIAVLQANN